MVKEYVNDTKRNPSINIYYYIRIYNYIEITDIDLNFACFCQCHKKNMIFHGPMAQWDGMPGLGLDDAALPEGREPASRRSTPAAAPGGTILGAVFGAKSW